MTSNSLIQNRFLGLALALSAGLALSAAAAEVEAPESSLSQSRENSDPWAFEIVPYLWLAGYDGTIGVPDVPARLSGAPRASSDSTEPFTSHLSAAAMLTARVRYRDFGLLLDGAWVQVKTEGQSDVPLYSATEMKSDIAYGTAALSYRLRPVKRLETDVFAGARTWFISNELTFEPGTAQAFSAESSRTWTDPIVGAQLRYDLSRHWFGTVLGDVGGFGAGSDITWSVFGGIGYRFTSWFSATLGYRYMHVDYDQEQFLMNANIQGFLLGLGFQF